jgi:cell division protein FtsW
MSLQSFVSIGVNLGLLPTKGLTLPLISSGGSSVLMTCAALGLLLRVSYELDRAQRQVARLRGEAMPAADTANSPPPPTAQPLPATGKLARGTARLRPRIEPALGQAQPGVSSSLGLRKRK